jgi:hypothetical protein
MSNPRTTFVSVLLDETGSMSSIKDDTIGGLNAYIEKLQKTDGEMLFSLVSFNSSKTRKRYAAEPIERVRPLTDDDYEPNAMTPLIDASVKIIKATAEAVEKRGDDPAVVIVLQTDGLENVSVEYKAADLALLVKEKEQAGWQFIFLGAGLDAFAAAREAGLHIDPVRVVSYDRARSREVFAASAANVVNYVASGDAANLSFSKEQRARVGDRYTGRYLDPAAGPRAPGGSAGKQANAKKDRKATAEKRGEAAGEKSGKSPSSVDDFDLVG